MQMIKNIQLEAKKLDEETDREEEKHMKYTLKAKRKDSETR